ncbi:MAG: ABC transporter substrate-binding protein [Alphaproteobacteria bacterium]|nr:ABC transporter substrate-binding protein [Alphaproteobacteria bacterium]
MNWLRASAMAAFVLATGAAVAAEPVKLGMITTLSTKAGYLGEDIRDGFLLAIDMAGGRLGGVKIELLIEDDELKPEKAQRIAERMVTLDGVRLMTGIVFSNVAMATVPKLVRDGIVYVSPNAGPSALAGKGCHPNYFNVAWQNDNQHEAIGKYVSDRGFKRLFILAPNYPAGRDALAGFKRYYTGPLVGEVYTALDQTDYSSEIGAIRAAKPDGVFVFLPGGMGISFVKQYSLAGLNRDAALFGPGFSFDERLLKAVGEAAVGVHNGSQWSHDLDNPANRSFVAAFRETYGRTPTLYAAQGFDAANLIGGALAAVGGDVSNPAKLAAALKTAPFTSVRGAFAFGRNNHPIQDFYVREVVRLDDGTVTNRIKAKAFSAHHDAYAAECGM